MYRLGERLRACVGNLGVSGLGLIFENEQDAVHCIVHLAMHKQVPFENYPPRWRSAAPWTRQPVLPSPTDWEEAHFVPYDAWTNRVLPGRRDADEKVRVPRVIPPGHPRGIPSFHHCDLQTGFKLRGEWFDASDNIVAGPFDGSVPTGMNDAAMLPSYPEDSKVERDGSLKPGLSVDTPVEGHGDWRNHILGEPDDGNSDGADGGSGDGRPGGAGGGGSDGDGGGSGSPRGVPTGGNGGSGGDSRAPPPLRRRARGNLGLYFNLSSATPEVPPLVGMHSVKSGIVVDVTSEGGTAGQPVVLAASPKYDPYGYAGDHATQAETWADVRCGSGSTLAGRTMTVLLQLAVGTLVGPVPKGTLASRLCFLSTAARHCCYRRVGFYLSRVPPCRPYLLKNAIVAFLVRLRSGTVRQ